MKIEDFSSPKSKEKLEKVKVNSKSSEQTKQEEALNAKREEEREINRKRSEYEYIQKKCCREIQYDARLLTHRSPAEVESIKRSLPKGPVGELYWPMMDLVTHLALPLEDGKFELLVGEDASGRIPALILRQVINGIYEMSKRPHPKMIFLAGGSNLPDRESREKKMDAIATHLREKEIDPMNIKNALIITDVLHTGGSVALLSRAFGELNISTEIASVAATKWTPGYPYGTYGYHVGELHLEPRILHRSHLSGVEKEASDVHAKKADVLQKHITQARQDAGVVADMLMKWYLEIRPIALRHIKEVRAFETRQKRAKKTASKTIKKYENSEKSNRC